MKGGKKHNDSLASLPSSVLRNYYPRNFPTIGVNVNLMKKANAKIRVLILKIHWKNPELAWIPGPHFENHHLKKWTEFDGSGKDLFKIWKIWMNKGKHYTPVGQFAFLGQAFKCLFYLKSNWLIFKDFCVKSFKWFSG